ncbi:hypothetical protein [Pseudaestuariivita atlantica]|uniref:Uncharacterized protein n=1 Tax=Pseudaestuariivita atlantica TaxID=1317121 RepID=A0A0L1JS60_9RHOB|nr:hypothetical protein [Pseudaestuariivita atlantica]KNG94585.1 hypothetical protein ATO11_04050 [Pseudaestuariivita atlantica]
MQGKQTAIAIAHDQRSSLMQIGLVSGLAGGLAEILWITAYSAGSNTSAATVARGVSEAVGFGGGASPVALGIIIHLLLAGALGVAVVGLMRALPLRDRGWTVDLLLAVTALSGVWAFNFLILLPVLSPEFVTIVPMPVSFVSKLLFGLAAFVAFKASDARTTISSRR